MNRVMFVVTYDAEPLGPEMCLSVQGVFTSQELADAYIAEHKDEHDSASQWDVEEHVLDEGSR